jgi:hypothetical protein
MKVLEDLKARRENAGAIRRAARTLVDQALGGRSGSDNRMLTRR